MVERGSWGGVSDEERLMETGRVCAAPSGRTGDSRARVESPRTWLDAWASRLSMVDRGNHG
jgi:hypothetical protein